VCFKCEFYSFFPQAAGTNVGWQIILFRKIAALLSAAITLTHLPPFIHSVRRIQLIFSPSIFASLAKKEEAAKMGTFFIREGLNFIKSWEGQRTIRNFFPSFSLIRFLSISSREK
jgi:hypothetical protein